jgi:acetyl-CoA/propionyl-CoA carboxylase carboxyl transferase subunit
VTADVERPVHRSDPRELLTQRRQTKLRLAAPGGERQFTARQRVEHFVDQGTFVELAPLRHPRPGGYGPRRTGVDGDGVVTGWGMVEGSPVVVISHDFSVSGGSIGAVFADKVMEAQRLAIDYGHPIVYINDSGGARIHEGIEALHGCGGIFALNVEASHVIPQISLIMGPCAGAAAYSPALTDWTIMVKGHGQMFLTGPEVVKAATGEVVTPDEIGGSQLHTKHSGVAHLEVASETAAFAAARQLLSFVPSTVHGSPRRSQASAPEFHAADRLPTLVPDSASAPYDMRVLLDGVLDDSARLELMPTYGTSVLTHLARLDGRPVGVVANQPRGRGGILDSASSVKAARFVNFCARFGLPIVTFVDVPGFLPGSVEERRGVITHGAGLLRAYVEAKVPKVTVIVRKAYGGAYIAMGSKSLGADFTWAWAGAEVAVMGPGGAVGILHRRDLRGAEDPAALRRTLSEEYRESVTRPYLAAQLGIVDEVIFPEETRERLCAALNVLGHSWSSSSHPFDRHPAGAASHNERANEREMKGEPWTT